MKDCLLVGSIGSLKAAALTIGTFYALQSEGYNIIGMTGASGGSLPLPLLGQNLPMNQVIDIFKKIPGDSILDMDITQQGIDWIRKKFGIPRKGDKPFTGLYRGNALRQTLLKMYKENNAQTFESAKIPFLVVATKIAVARDRVTNDSSVFLNAVTHPRHTIFKQGDVVSPIRGSTAIPLVFKEEEINGELYLDGGIVDAIPILPALQHFGPYDVFIADAASTISEEPLYADEVDSVIEIMIATIYTMFRDATLTKIEDALKILSLHNKNMYRIRANIKIKMTETEKMSEAILESYYTAKATIKAI